MKFISVIFLVCFLGCSHEHPLTEHEHNEAPHEHELAEHKHPLETHEHQHSHEFIEHVHELISHEHQPKFVEHEHDTPIVEPEIDKDLERLYSELSGNYTLVEIEVWSNDEGLTKLTPPQVSGSLVIDGYKMKTTLDGQTYVSYYTVEPDGDVIGSYLDSDFKFFNFVGLYKWDGKMLSISLNANDGNAVNLVWLRI